MNEEQLRCAYQIWYRNYAHKSIDEKVEPFLTVDIKASKGGWLRKTRLALFLSTGKVAEKLQVSRSAYSKFERNEEDGSIKLETLAKIAEVMDCELIYALRPKKKMRFSQLIWQKLVPISLLHQWVKTRPRKVKSNALAYIAQQNAENSKFRKEQGWSER